MDVYCYPSAGVLSEKSLLRYGGKDCETILRRRKKGSNKLRRGSAISKLVTAMWAPLGGVRQSRTDSTRNVLLLIAKPNRFQLGSIVEL